MGSLVDLSSAIVGVLQNVQQDGFPALADIQTTPSTQFSGTPGATVVPSDNDSDYATVVQNFRHYVFYVDLYVSMQTEGDGPTVAFTTMLTLIDTCLDAFDMSNTLNGTCQILHPTPSAWSIVATNDGALLTGRITLTCGVTVVTNNG